MGMSQRYPGSIAGRQNAKMLKDTVHVAQRSLTSVVLILNARAAGGCVLRQMWCRLLAHVRPISQTVGGQLADPSNHSPWLSGADHLPKLSCACLSACFYMGMQHGSQIYIWRIISSTVVES